MPLLTSRIPFNHLNPYRPVRPATNKIIFWAFEGSVTEEEYFAHVSNLFSEIKSRIQFISVAEDAVHTSYRNRTADQIKLLSKVRPKQLVDRIDQFKSEKDEIFQFDLYPDDEFWIVTDVDKNWSTEIINTADNKSYLDEWNDAVTMCQQKNYGYAISNPFFEIWLLLHHDDANDDDRMYAVTESHEYESTNHFRTRLRNLGVPLKHSKQIDNSDYTIEKIAAAVARAEALHINKSDMYPKYLSTTVYKLLTKMMDMVHQENERENKTEQ